MPAPVIDPATVQLRPGARWTRILIAVRGAALPAADILRQTSEGRPVFRVEHRKLRQALYRMAEHGLIEHAGAWGWTATADGRAAVERLEART